MTDPNVLICPSDASGSADNWTSPDGENLFGYMRYDPNTKILSAKNGRGCNHGGTCMSAVDQSYGYFGYVFDRVDDSFPVRSTQALVQAGVLDVVGDGPAQAVFALEAILGKVLPAYQAILGGSPGPGPMAVFNAATAGDLSVPAGHGNGGGGSILHLK